MLAPVPVELIEYVCLFLISIKVGSSESDDQGYVLLMASDVELEQVLDEIPVVREYLDVFRNDIPVFPPEREIEFSIDSVPGIEPIFIAPYRMSLMKLMELKSQLKELLGKKFVRPSASPWGASVCGL